MFRVLIADDNYEDRDLVKLEIERALGGKETDIGFHEAASITQAVELLKSRHFDLMTLDIQFDRMNEGIEALPKIFEEHPTLNIIVISGKLNKSEVSEQLFRFTKDNVLKGKRWARHFDVLDKKDDKTEAFLHAYSFALKRKEVADKVKDLFLVAESHLEKNELDQCLNIYRKIQDIAPGEPESIENIDIVKGTVSVEQALEYLRKGEKIVAALLMGHYLENRLRAFTRKKAGRSIPGLYDCLKELERTRRISPFKKDLFHKVLRLRNKSIHSPNSISEKDFDAALQNLKLLEAKF